MENSEWALRPDTGMDGIDGQGTKGGRGVRVPVPYFAKITQMVLVGSS